MYCTLRFLEFSIVVLGRVAQFDSLPTGGQQQLSTKGFSLIEVSPDHNTSFGTAPKKNTAHLLLTIKVKE